MSTADAILYTKISEAQYFIIIIIFLFLCGGFYSRDVRTGYFSTQNRRATSAYHRPTTTNNNNNNTINP